MRCDVAWVQSFTSQLSHTGHFSTDAMREVNGPVKHCAFKSIQAEDLRHPSLTCSGGSVVKFFETIVVCHLFVEGSLCGRKIYENMTIEELLPASPN